MVDAADLKSVGCNGRASSSLATPTIVNGYLEKLSQIAAVSVLTQFN
jgi:hypothetical protein